jgi:ABC-2 type transport system permease protein
LIVLGLIVRKEVIEILRDGRLRAAACTVFLLLAVSLASGWSQQQRDAEERVQAARHARDVWTGQGPKDPHIAAHFGTFAFKPSGPLSLIDRGVNPYTGVAIYLEAHRMNEAQYSAAQDRTILQRFGAMTAAVTMQVLMPLLIVLLSFGSFAGEREAGTLRQVASLGVRPAILGMGKLLGVGSALALLVIPATALGAVALDSANSAFGASDVPRVAGLGVVYLGYFLLVLALSLLVSLYSRKARTALVVLIGVWGWNGLLAPPVFSDLARAIYPTPTATALEAMGRDESTRAVSQPEVAAELQEKLGISDPRDLPVNIRGVMHLRNEESSNRVWDKRFNLLWDQYDRQSRLVSWGGVIAPLLAVRSLSMALAGTDFAHHRDFSWAAENYRRRMMVALNSDLAYNSRTGQSDYAAGSVLWQSIPDFHYETPSWRWALRDQKASFIALSAWLAFLLGAIGLRIRRLPVL